MNCELCGTPISVKNRRPDHEHFKHSEDRNGTGEGSFRGVLCNKCNLALGAFENIGVKRINDYLDSARSKVEQFNKRPIAELINDVALDNDKNTI